MLGHVRLLAAFLLCTAMALAGALPTPAGAAPSRTTTETRVYLLRGLADIFSLGLDDLAAKLNQRGIHAMVGSHAGTEAIADEIIARRAAGWRGAVVLVGHSLGANEVYPLAARLAEANVPVQLVVSFDPVENEVVPRNVAKAVNYYVSGGYPVRPGPGFKGSLSNLYMEGKDDLGHLNIEKSPRLHAEVIAKVVALGSARRSAKPKQPPAAAPAANSAASEADTATTAGVPAPAPTSTH